MLDPGEHGADQVDPLQAAHDDGHQAMHAGERDQGGGERLVDLLHPLLAPEGVRGLQEAGQAECEDQRHQREHHQRAQGTVAGLEVVLAGAHRRQVGAQPRGGREEVGEARVPAADEAPDQAGDDETRGGVADQLVQRLAVIDDEEVQDDAAHQAPVEDAHERVPDPQGKFGIGRGAWRRLLWREEEGGARPRAAPMAAHLRSSSAPVSGLK